MKNSLQVKENKPLLIDMLIFHVMLIVMGDIQVVIPQNNKIIRKNFLDDHKLQLQDIAE